MEDEPEGPEEEGQEEDRRIIREACGYDIYKMLPIWQALEIGQHHAWDFDHSMNHHGESQEETKAQLEDDLARGNVVGKR